MHYRRVLMEGPVCLACLPAGGVSESVQLGVGLTALTNRNQVPKDPRKGSFWSGITRATPIFNDGWIGFVRNDNSTSFSGYESIFNRKLILHMNA